MVLAGLSSKVKDLHFAELAAGCMLLLDTRALDLSFLIELE